MKKKRNEYIAQFYRGNRGMFFLAVLTALLATGLHLIIARALQQMIDGISGVPGAPGLAATAVSRRARAGVPPSGKPRPACGSRNLHSRRGT